MQTHMQSFKKNHNKKREIIYIYIYIYCTKDYLECRRTIENK